MPVMQATCSSPAEQGKAYAAKVPCNTFSLAPCMHAGPQSRTVSSWDWDWDEYCKGMCEVWKGLQYAARLYMAQRAQERAKKSD